MELEQTSIQEWVQKRVSAVESEYSVFDILTENGVELSDSQTSLQIACPFPEHGPDNRPSARYYAPGNGRPSAFHCFKCKYHFSTIALYSKFKNLKFMEALHELEKRFRISVPRRPESHDFNEPQSKDSNYTSSQWSDVPRVLDLMENKLIRIRSKVALIDFTKYCRVLDAVRWDFEHSQNQSTPDMVLVLQKLRNMMTAAEEEFDAISRLQNPS